LDTDISLASAAVRDGSAALRLGNLDHATSNDGSGEGCSEEVDVLVDAIALDRWEAELLNKLALQVGDMARQRTALDGLLLCCLKVLLLTNIGHEADNIVALFDQPRENAAGVKTTAVRETHLEYPASQSLVILQLKCTSSSHLFFAHIE
jgi:hypothetical protein